MIIVLGRKFANKIIEKINQCKKSSTLRIVGHENAFTRDRILTAKHVVAMIIEPAKQSLQARLCEFGVKFMKGAVVTKQAFSKQRQYVNPEFIREFYDENVEMAINEGELITFKDMHLTGIDGTRLSCENAPELIAEYGCSGSKKDACTALASVAYDLIERISYDCQIGSYSRSERDLMIMHLDRLEAFCAEKFLIIADRGYPSYKLMEAMVDRGFYFLLRLGDNWTDIIRRTNSSGDKDIKYDYKGKSYNFRCLKIALEDKTEYLITNLDRNTLTIDEAKRLYSLRWNVETFFGFLKTELELENFSGKTKNSVVQEFYAAMTLANVCQCFINNADGKIAKNNVGGERIYVHQANRRQCVGRIIPVFLECVFTESKRKQDRLWKEVEQFCERFSEPIRPDRRPDRKLPRDKKFYANARKPNLS